jgi:hypothetical protein
MEVKEMLDKMQRHRFIEESQSPWSSPFVLVRKKNGEFRLCVNYRKLSNVTKKDSSPMPRINDIMYTLAGAKWFSDLNLKSGYWQVDVHPDDKEKTAFLTGQMLWQFTVLLFGLSNAHSTFKRLMETVLLGLTYDACLVYLDDVIIIDRTFQVYLLNLRKIFERFREKSR